MVKSLDCHSRDRGFESRRQCSKFHQLGRSFTENEDARGTMHRVGEVQMTHTERVAGLDQRYLVGKFNSKDPRELTVQGGA